ncbi:MAG TPA: tRNA pseudouridine(55) synthase TruB [Candidatus Manganitrophaceae bacterium]|nr:tRNA pseudouridine(55) synthase TruB [Candidatus Manganitrophaceae bacterium]
MTKDGVINVNKPIGWTSHDVVAKLRGMLKIKKVGHTGTLDPQATGVLPVCLGKGTRIVPFLMDVDKEYRAVLRLGQETDTQDASGKVLRSSEVPPSALDAVSGALQSFVGAYLQMPPMYSAVKINGVPLYKSARLGKEIERAPREVAIRSVRFHRREGNDITFSVVCSKGTYVRTLCADIGSRLGVGGHLVALERVRSGNFHVDDSVTIESLSELYSKGEWEKEIYSINEVLEALPAVWIKESHLQKVHHGAPVGMEGIAASDPFEKGMPLRFLDSQGTLLGIGAASAEPSRGEGNSAMLFKVKTNLSEREEPVSVERRKFLRQGLF